MPVVARPRLRRHPQRLGCRPSPQPPVYARVRQIPHTTRAIHLLHPLLWMNSDTTIHCAEGFPTPPRRTLFLDDAGLESGHSTDTKLEFSIPTAAMRRWVKRPGNPQASLHPVRLEKLDVSVYEGSRRNADDLEVAVSLQGIATHSHIPSLSTQPFRSVRPFALTGPRYFHRHTSGLVRLRARDDDTWATSFRSGVQEGFGRRRGRRKLIVRPFFPGPHPPITQSASVPSFFVPNQPIEDETYEESIAFATAFKDHDGDALHAFVIRHNHVPQQVRHAPPHKADVAELVVVHSRLLHLGNFFPSGRPSPAGAALLPPTFLDTSSSLSSFSVVGPFSFPVSIARLPSTLSATPAISPRRTVLADRIS
ncbi:hypothetical protein C8F01DRAFT_1371692 [Mycena amicta]|nr:hypothetical protein C8F01DRAFT_1371692 [Mycena amicta]